jgi:hypothetical protein
MDDSYIEQSGGSEKTQVDYIGSDMFASVCDVVSKCGIFIGFLSLKKQFSSISLNRSYDRMSVHISGDGDLVPL